MSQNNWMIKLVLLGSLLSFTACSTQYTEVDGQMDPDQVIQMIDDVLNSPSAASADSSARQEFISIKEDPNSQVYVSYGPGELGPTFSVASLIEFDFLGFSNVYWDTIEDIRIFFVTLEGRSALLIDIKNSGSDSYITRFYSSANGDTVLGDDEFSTLMSASGGKIVLRSVDVTDGELNTVIQLKVYLIDSATGEEILMGKFSTLMGYGP